MLSDEQMISLIEENYPTAQEPLLEDRVEWAAELWVKIARHLGLTDEHASRTADAGDGKGLTLVRGISISGWIPE